MTLPERIYIEACVPLRGEDYVVRGTFQRSSLPRVMNYRTIPDLVDECTIDSIRVDLAPWDQLRGLVLSDAEETRVREALVDALVDYVAKHAED